MLSRRELLTRLIGGAVATPLATTPRNMSWALNNITAPDNYGNTSTLSGLPLSSRVNIDVSNSAIYWQLQQTSTGVEGNGTWGQEVFMGPGSRSLSRRGITGIRIRAAVPAAQLPATAKQAQVTVEVI